MRGFSSAFSFHPSSLLQRERAVATLLILCILLVAGWEIASKLAAQPFDELRLKPEDFSGFAPVSKDWSIRLVHLRSAPTEPTVIAYMLQRRSPSFPPSPPHSPQSSPSLPSVQKSPVLCRIVHGYNMVDCMRIKQYKVDLLKDTRSKYRNRKPEARSPNPERPTSLPSVQTDTGISGSPTPPFNLSPLTSNSHLPVQLWRLTSATQESRVWYTTMLRTADFSATAVDTRDMAFPRIGNPDDPSWAPTGLKWSSFRHPIRNLRDFMRAKWNASRSDIWTFLRLRQPAWASDEMLTMVSEYRGKPLKPEEEQAAAQLVLEAHSMMLQQFQQFWKSKGEELGLLPAVSGSAGD
jgi:hypothetical protein